MTDGQNQTELRAAIAGLDEQAALALVRQRIAAGADPLRIMEECGEGMRLVGERYEQGQYYIAGLIMAGEIFRQVMEVLQPLVQERISGQASGQILLGTVAGDIHGIGRNILGMLLNCFGFVVHDLGVDVPPDEFVARVAEMQPNIIGLSGLLTSSYDSMRETVDLLRGTLGVTGTRPPIVIGGGMINEDVCRYVGADHWSTNAMDGVRLCQRLATE